MALAIPRPGPTNTLAVPNPSSRGAARPRPVALALRPRLPAAPGRLHGSPQPRLAASPARRLPVAAQPCSPASVPAGRTPQPRSAARRSGLGSRRPPARPPAAARHLRHSGKPAAGQSSMEQQPSSSRKGKRKAPERDLRRYFNPSGSTNPSTHGSGVGNATIEEEEVVETHLEDTNTIGQEDVVQMPVEEAHGQDVGSNENDQGQVVEKFLGIKHVKLTTSEALKRAMVEVLSAYGLTIAKLRGQGYDGASNMRDMKTRLVNLRSEGYEPLLEEAKTFCQDNDIPIPNMEDSVPRFGRSRKGGRNNITQDHYFRVDTFYAAIDAITTEFDHRFNELILVQMLI
ncbi:hypothetical protein U9M48_013629 [Paspalum notatum var. saurae]|uniref:DUF4371 domain-containing protein n=1 Tax=Paspalum notatum var. saurae TaxID=547442 RepID=A0AAQ3T127_PASNO